LARFYARHPLSKKEKRKLAARLVASLGHEAGRAVREAERVEIARTREGVVLYYVDGVPLFIETQDKLMPTILGAATGVCKLPKVSVDDGAVPHIVNGADVMVPGIVKVEGEFTEGSLVIVVDLKGRVVAIGQALMASDVVLRSRKGRAIRNLHYAGDKLWRTYFERRFLRMLEG